VDGAHEVLTQRPHRDVGRQVLLRYLSGQREMRQRPEFGPLVDDRVTELGASLVVVREERRALLVIVRPWPAR
jgi:hypothetical protein